MRAKPDGIWVVGFLMIGVGLLLYLLRTPTPTPAAAPNAAPALPISDELQIDWVAVMGAESSDAFIRNPHVRLLPDGRTVEYGTSFGTVNYFSLNPVPRKGTFRHTSPLERRGKFDKFTGVRNPQGQLATPRHYWSYGTSLPVARASWIVDDDGGIYLAGNSIMPSNWQGIFPSELPHTTKEDRWVLRFSPLDLERMDTAMPERGVIFYGASLNSRWLPPVATAGSLWCEPYRPQRIGLSSGTDADLRKSDLAMARWGSDGTLELIPIPPMEGEDILDFAPDADGSGVWLVSRPDFRQMTEEQRTSLKSRLTHLDVHGKRTSSAEVPTGLSFQTRLLPLSSGGLYFEWKGTLPVDDDQPWPEGTAPRDSQYRIARFDANGKSVWFRTLGVGCRPPTDILDLALGPGEDLWFAGYFLSSLHWEGKQLLSAATPNPNSRDTPPWDQTGDLFLASVSDRGDLTFLKQLAECRTFVCSMYIPSSHTEYEGDEVFVGSPSLAIRGDQLRLIAGFSGRLEWMVAGEPITISARDNAPSTLSCAITLAPATNP